MKSIVAAFWKEAKQLVVKDESQQTAGKSEPVVWFGASSKRSVCQDAHSDNANVLMPCTSTRGDEGKHNLNLYNNILHITHNTIIIYLNPEDTHWEK